MKVLRLFFLLGTLGLLAYGLFWESHAFYGDPKGKAQAVDGRGFIAEATVDRFILNEDGRLLDRFYKKKAASKECFT